MFSSKLNCKLEQLNLVSPLVISRQKSKSANYFYHNIWNRNTFGPLRSKDRKQTPKKALENESRSSVASSQASYVHDEHSVHWTNKIKTQKRLNLIKNYLDKEDHIYRQFLEDTKAVEKTSHLSKKSKGNEVNVKDETFLKGAESKPKLSDQDEEQYQLKNTFRFDNPARNLELSEYYKSYAGPLRHSRVAEFVKNNPCSFPSVTKILQDSMSEDQKLILQKWEEKMIEKLGLAGFREYKKQLFSRGRKLHSFIENKLLDPAKDDSYEKGDEITKNHIKSIRKVLKDFSKPLALESHVLHPKLHYQGYLDCVALYKGNQLTLIDWKTSERKKNSLSATFDNPLQIMAYVGAFNHDPKYGNVRITQGKIVLAYNDGSPADVLSIKEGDMEYYWNQWLQRLELYKDMNH